MKLNNALFIIPVIAFTFCSNARAMADEQIKELTKKFMEFVAKKENERESDLLEQLARETNFLEKVARERKEAEKRFVAINVNSQTGKRGKRHSRNVSSRFMPYQPKASQTPYSYVQQTPHYFPEQHTPPVCTNGQLMCQMWASSAIENQQSRQQLLLTRRKFIEETSALRISASENMRYVRTANIPDFSTEETSNTFIFDPYNPNNFLPDLFEK